jgi:DNA repair protein RadD
MCVPARGDLRPESRIGPEGDTPGLISATTVHQNYRREHIVSVAGAPASLGAPALRPYQRKSVDDLRTAFRSHRRVLLVSPTGSGKTVEFSYIVASAILRGRRCCVVVHRDELIEQTRRALQATGIECGSIVANHPANDAAPAQIASLPTLARRLDRYLGAFDFLVVDEAHHAVARTWRGVLEAFPDIPVLGATATPERLDGAGLGDIFDAMVIGPEVAELTRLGYLAPAITYAPACGPDLSRIAIRGGDFDTHALAKTMLDSGLVGDAVEQYVRLAAGMPAIVFAVTIAHSKALKDRFVAAGFRAAHVDGDTPKAERRELVSALANGKLDVLSNCGLIAEGFDAPAVGAVIMARPTRSLALFLQMAGRALRPSPGKTRALILDHGGNVFRFGLPDATRIWSLDGREPSAVEPRATIRRCGSCGAVTRAAARSCPGCGSAFPARSTVPTSAPGTLVPFTSDAQAAIYGSEERYQFHAELAAIALERSFQPGWAGHRFKEKFGQWPPVRVVEPAKPTLATRSWVRAKMVSYARERAGA